MLRDSLRETEPLIAVSEVYESIQGEGLLVGLPSVFIRLQGCNLRCPWCDQPSALAFGQKRTPLGELVRGLKRFCARHAVITGGEPFAHEELPLLAQRLLDEGYSVQVETNCTLWVEGMEGVAPRVYITCSPKGVAGYRARREVLRYANELKFVVDEELSLDVLKREEFLPFLKEGRLVLQPESNRREMMSKALEMARKLVSEGFSVRVIPQIHKFFGLK